MAPLVLDLKSPVVDLAVSWVKERGLLSFDLFGRADEGFEPWAEDIRKKQSLCEFDFGTFGVGLDLNAQNLGDDRGEQVARALLSDQQLTALHLASNRLTDAIAAWLAAAVANNGPLRHLDLTANSLSDSSCEALALALEKSKRLRSLRLGRNCISSVGAATLGAALRENDFLVELDLSRNAIDDEGAEWIAAALEVNPYVLATLDLSGNAVCNRSARRLREVFDKSFTLRRLRLDTGCLKKRVRRQPSGEPYLQEDQHLPTSEPFVVRCARLGAEILRGQHQAELDDDEEEGPRMPKYTLTQDEDELDVIFEVKGMSRAEKSRVSVLFTERQLRVQVDGVFVVDVELYSRIQPKECSWTAGQDTVEIFLVKAKLGETWPQLTRD